MRCRTSIAGLLCAVTMTACTALYEALANLGEGKARGFKNAGGTHL